MNENEAGRLAIDALFDANKDIAALSQQVKELEAERDGLREAAYLAMQELRNIINVDPTNSAGDINEFKLWSQNRARHTLAKCDDALAAGQEEEGRRRRGKMDEKLCGQCDHNPVCKYIGNVPFPDYCPYQFPEDGTATIAALRKQVAELEARAQKAEAQLAITESASATLHILAENKELRKQAPAQEGAAEAYDEGKITEQCLIAARLLNAELIGRLAKADKEIAALRQKEGK